MSQNLYIVPYDFTPVGDAAIRYALHLAKNVKAEILVLHLASSKPEGQKAIARLNSAIDRFEKPYGVQLTTLVRVGSIFEDLGKIAKTEGAQLVIMGTHGSTGMQRLLGSNAMKVITAADTPFLVVQKDTQLNDIKNIVVPIDLTKESLQITNIAGDIALMFNASIHVIGEKHNDALLSQQMKNRVLIVKNQYDDRNIECHVELIKSGGSYQKKILTYSKEKSIDFIAIAYHSESLLPQFDTFAQSLITNDQKLPCMVLNSKLASALYF